MAPSTYPSYGWSVVKRGELPMVAASDIWIGAPVCIASNGDRNVVMCLDSAHKPIGIARDFAAYGQPVAVFDEGNTQRTWVGAGASFSRQSYIGVVGTSSGTHPISAVAVTYPLLGQVSGTPSVGVGASTTSVWAIGVAWESAAVGDAAEFHIEPRLLSGLVGS